MYRVLGPFPFGGRELSDPTQAFSTDGTGVPTDSNFPSELGDNATVQWAAVSTGEKGQLSYAFPNIRWNVVTVPYGEMAISIQGWAVGVLSVAEETQEGEDGDTKAFLLHLAGMHVLYLDGERVYGDPYESGYMKQHVHLSVGNHTVAIPFLGSRGVQFALTLERVAGDAAALELLEQDAVLPDVVEGFLAGSVSRSSETETGSAGSGRASDDVGLPRKVREAYASVAVRSRRRQWISGVRVTAQSPDGCVVGAGPAPKPSNLPQLRIAPAATRPLDLLLRQTRQCRPCPSPNTACPLNLTVIVTANGKELARGVFPMRHLAFSFDLPGSRGYKFTFLDADASVQYAAAIPPTLPCPTPTGCAVLVATHGAGVEAGDWPWTSSFARQQHAWVLLPTNRRTFGYDWQGPGLRNALLSIRALGNGGSCPPGVPPAQQSEDNRATAGLSGGARELDASARGDCAPGWGADEKRLLFAGHSMGGHGCLVLSTHFPGHALGSACAAGWIQSEMYPPSLLRTDFSLGTPWINSVLGSAIGEYDVAYYLPNVVGLPVIVRMGADDDNVPPYNLLRVARILEQLAHTQRAVKVSEVPGQGHWWGGVVDDPTMQQFYDKHLHPHAQPELPEDFVIQGMNPATHGGRAGIRVMQLLVPYRGSRVRVNTSASPWTLTTENVRRLQFSGPQWAAAHVALDGELVAVQDGATVVCAPSSAGCDWQAQAPDSPWARLERSPATYGPAAQVFEGPLVIVPGNHSWMQKAAQDIAQDLYVQGRWGVEIVSAEEFVSSAHARTSNNTFDPFEGCNANLLVIGDPYVNAAAGALERAWQEHLPPTALVRFHSRGGFNIGKSVFAEEGVGLHMLSPIPTRRTGTPRLALLVAGTDSKGTRLAAGVFGGNRGFKSGMTIPDYMILKESFKWGGDQGILAAGFWDNNWEPSLLCGTIEPALQNRAYEESSSTDTAGYASS